LWQWGYFGACTVRKMRAGMAGWRGQRMPVSAKPMHLGAQAETRAGFLRMKGRACAQRSSAQSPIRAAHRVDKARKAIDKDCEHLNRIVSRKHCYLWRLSEALGISGLQSSRTFCV
jgi:hypothetical protein